MRLADLVASLGGHCAPATEEERTVTDVHVDSRRVGSGDLFAALPGTRTDGARFATRAAEQGASAVLSPRGLEELLPAAVACPNWIHPDARRVAGEAAALVHGRPARELQVVAVTGTNGKTTVAHLIGQLLEGLGSKPAVLGTVGYRLWGGELHEATHTTPDATELQRLARRQVELGGDALVLEASSHALDQERLAGLTLDVAVFTNLSRDHLDYHPDMQAYAAAKEKIFLQLGEGGTAVICADDPWAAHMQRAAEAAGARVITYGIRSRADLSASRLRVGPQGTNLFLEGMGVPWTGLFLPLVGRHNVENALAALAAVLSMGASSSRAVEGLATVSSPPGRLEPVGWGEGRPRVYVDYAHTPEALERVLIALRELGGERQPAGRVICVFGCGGERDQAKRAPMGRVAGELADLAVVTSDNPRSEDPQAIAAAVLAGMTDSRAEVVVEIDRRAAIRRALSEASEHDVVLVAGRGHEAWQQLSERRIPFDDKRVVLEELP